MDFLTLIEPDKKSTMAFVSEIKVMCLLAARQIN
jgi:hypothetical protein